MSNFHAKKISIINKFLIYKIVQVFFLLNKGTEIIKESYMIEPEAVFTKLNDIC